MNIHKPATIVADRLDPSTVLKIYAILTRKKRFRSAK